MRVTIEPRGGPGSALYDLIARRTPPVLHDGHDITQDQYLSGLNEHDLRDIEFVLAQRRAMSKRCTAEDGEHTCGQDPGHTEPQAHLCRACTRRWPAGQEPA